MHMSIYSALYPYSHTYKCLLKHGIVWIIPHLHMVVQTWYCDVGLPPPRTASTSHSFHHHILLGQRSCLPPSLQLPPYISVQHGDHIISNYRNYNTRIILKHIKVTLIVVLWQQSLVVGGGGGIAAKHTLDSGAGRLPAGCMDRQVATGGGTRCKH